MCNAGLSPMSCGLKFFESRVRRVTPLKVASVFALLKLRRFRRIAGGTAEGIPFVPIVGMEGLFLSKYLFRHSLRRATFPKGEGTKCSKLPFRRIMK